MGHSSQLGSGLWPASRRLAVQSSHDCGLGPRPHPDHGLDFTTISSGRGELVALDAETIQQLHNTLRSLPRPLLESLTRAFRKRFEVPDTAVTIADRISQKSHHDWIEAFLVSHREVRSLKPHREVRLAEPHREMRSAEQHQGAST